MLVLLLFNITLLLLKPECSKRIRSVTTLLMLGPFHCRVVSTQQALYWLHHVHVLWQEALPPYRRSLFSFKLNFISRVSVYHIPYRKILEKWGGGGTWKIACVKSQFNIFWYSLQQIIQISWWWDWNHTSLTDVLHIFYAVQKKSAHQRLSSEIQNYLPTYGSLGPTGHDLYGSQNTEKWVP